MLPRIEVRRDRLPFPVEELLKSSAPDLRPQVSGPCVLTLDGESVLLIADVVDPVGMRQAVRRFPMSSVNRSAGLRNLAAVFGNLGPNALLKRYACSPCAAAHDHPHEHAVITGFAAYLAGVLHEELPEHYDACRAAVAGVRPDWLLPGGLWTSGVVNSASALPYHRDRNNFDAWSAMPVFRRGFTGGHLHFPELALTDGRPVVVDCSDLAAVFFNGGRWIHGVTPLVRRQPDGYRLSAVYYPVKRMALCGSPAEELRKAQHARTSLEEHLVERQRAAGLMP